ILYEAAQASVNKQDPFIIFTYSNDLYSLSGELANELKYRNQQKAVIIGRKHEDKVIMSLRSEEQPILKALERALQNVDGYGGGHPKACGAVVAQKDFDAFIATFKETMFNSEGFPKRI
ncbi:DHH family phosphoesterase, partial [Candidatus Woesearchaeota archaeon]|nr:DHH family phosphoesterase [Candidatus Woesearchaeota archaeon]